jgi:hypothetical protein
VIASTSPAGVFVAPETHPVNRPRAFAELVEQMSFEELNEGVERICERCLDQLAAASQYALLEIAMERDQLEAAQ